jgi:hypothetical protein
VPARRRLIARTRASQVEDHAGVTTRCTTSPAQSQAHHDHAPT